MKKQLVEGFIHVPDGNVWYKIYGIEKEGEPLLVIHGGPGASHDYLLPLAGLATRRPVIFYDQLGCGNSEKPLEANLRTTESYVRELEILCKELELNNYHILGQSWGAALAIEYLLTIKPHGIKSLILSAPLISTSLWVEDQRHYINMMPLETRETINRCEEEEDYSNALYQDAMMEFYKRHLCRMDPWPDCLNATFEKMNSAVYNHMWGPSEFTVTGVLKDFDRTDHLHQITIPVLLTAGEYDEATPERISYFAGKFPSSEIYVFKGASHSHHLECQGEYLKVVDEFLSR